MTLAELEARVAEAPKPPELAELSEHLVFGEGDPRADLVLIGEAPGEDEDLSGRPFVGRAGQLLDKILESVEISRDDVYITNIVKYRPPDNRTPKPEEIAASIPLLMEQIRILRPQVIAALGNTPSQYFLNTKEGITKTRGRWHVWNEIKVMPVFHPAYLLRNPKRERGSPKWLTWQDMKEIKAELGRLGPKPAGIVIDNSEQETLF
jgi:uracil-DNA glycosylase